MLQAGDDDTEAAGVHERDPGEIEHDVVGAVLDGRRHRLTQLRRRVEVELPVDGDHGPSADASELQRQVDLYLLSRGSFMPRRSGYRRRSRSIGPLVPHVPPPSRRLR